MNTWTVINVLQGQVIVHEQNTVGFCQIFFGVVVVISFKFKNCWNGVLVKKNLNIVIWKFMNITEVNLNGTRMEL